MNMTFKYEEDYNKLSHTCPPADYTPQNIEHVFRWVFDTMEDENNFNPQYYRNPKRFLEKEDLEKCKAMGLSMFMNLEDSITRFNELKRTIGQGIYRTLGERIAKGSIKMTDGVNSALERLSHFTHHPSNSTEYEKVFEIIKDLP